ncbi:MAG: hypothetical protein JWL90_2298 [Chthoniobacteraceae bacterium]|nr:hypothetical protein [Chthoniobacteraceae bacterium]
MWGEIHGRTKIDIAREAIGKVVGRRDSNTQLGLMAYGHRRKGDCNDIELLIPAGPLNRAAVVSADSAAFCSLSEPQLRKKAAGSISSRKITRPRTDLAIGVIALTRIFHGWLPSP